MRRLLVLTVLTGMFLPILPHSVAVADEECYYVQPDIPTGDPDPWVLVCPFGSSVITTGGIPPHV